MPAGHLAKAVSVGAKTVYVPACWSVGVGGAASTTVREVVELPAALATVMRASVAVGALTDLFDGRYLLGKLAVVPFTLCLNFLVSQRLLTQRAEAVA